MKKPLSPILIGITVVIAVVVFGFMFLKTAEGPAPQVTNLPDYAKMTPEEVAAAKAKSEAEGAEEMKKHGH